MTNFTTTTGYDQEERFFHQCEQEKIAAIREAREATKKALEQKLHWMKCPKCGHDMAELEVEGLFIDKCNECQGLYFDQGELELLMKHNNKQNFIEKIFTLHR